MDEQGTDLTDEDDELAATTTTTTAAAVRPRSHRAGVLGGLGAVGLLLAVLVLVAPGGSRPRLPAQSAHDLHPVTTITAAHRTAAPATPSSVPGSSTTTPVLRATTARPATAPAPAPPTTSTTICILVLCS